MFSLLLFCLISQPNFVGSRKSKVIIRRVQSSTGTDQLELPGRTCRYEDDSCTRFSAKDYQKQTSTQSCECSCSSQAATFTAFKGVCVNNEEFRETELQSKVMRLLKYLTIICVFPLQQSPANSNCHGYNYYHM